MAEGRHRQARSSAPMASRSRWQSCGSAGRIGPVQPFTIITTVANELCGAIHGRMPAILSREKWLLGLLSARPNRGDLFMMLLAQIAAWSMLAFSALLFVFQLVAHEIGFLIGRRQVERREAPGESIGALVGGLLDRK